MKQKNSSWLAGFELGSGMSINTALPEETAEFMRGIHVNNGELRMEMRMEMRQ